MGTWSTKIFGNDTAGNWLSRFERTQDFTLIEEALNDVFATGNSYLESDTAEAALAAVEVIALALGQPGFIGSDNIEDIEQWFEEFPLSPSVALVKKAHHALERILTPPSETLEGWASAEDREAWKQTILELKSRIDQILKQ